MSLSYDEDPYISLVYPNCQPIKLNAIAKLRGLTPPDLKYARILEIGCSFGANLLPFAIQFPNSCILGVDISGHQIEIGKKMLAEVGVDNIHLIKADISSLSFEGDKFDYIICHGVFSWVPESVRCAILECIEKNLSPNGIGYVSYNTYPGWHYKQKIRNLMLFGKENFGGNFQLDKLLGFIKNTKTMLEKRNVPDIGLFNYYENHIFTQSSNYILHDYLEEFNQPLYFSEFLEKLDHYQLGYVADTEVIDIQYNNLFLADEYPFISEYFKDNQEKIEQYADFVLDRTFRTSIITHKENVLCRNSCIDQLPNDLIKQLFFIPNIERVSIQEKDYYKCGGLLLGRNHMLDIVVELSNEGSKPISVEQFLAAGRGKEDIMYVLYLLLVTAKYLSFYPIYSENFIDKPYIVPKYRKLIQFIEQNPKVTKLTDFYYSGICLDKFLIFLSQYVNGQNDIEDLVDIVEKNLVYLQLNKSLQRSDIRQAVIKSLNVFSKIGFFTHY